MSVTVSLERTAAMIKAVEERLCQQCRVLSVVEWVGFGRRERVEGSGDGET